MAVSVALNFNFPDAATRDAWLLDFSKARNLDIYSDTIKSPAGFIIQMGTTVDPAKVVPAIRQALATEIKEAVVNYRGRAAGAMAEAAKRAADAGAVDP